MTRSAYVSLITLAAALAGWAAWMKGGPAPHLPEMAGPVAVGEGRSVLVQKYELSVAEWNACHDAGGCAFRLSLRPEQSADTTPATGLNFSDAGDYINWLNRETGASFRLPTLAEWRAVASTVLPATPDPVFTDPSLRWASAYLTEATTPRALRPAGSFSTTAEGIADLDGSVWEWTRDCYAGAAGSDDRCAAFFVAGVHTAAMAYMIRDPARGGCATGTPPAHLGMRLFADAETVTPEG